MSSLDKYLQERDALWDVMKKRKNTDVIEWYNTNSHMYDQNFPNAGFQYPKYIVDAVIDYVSNRCAVILDLGAGSGVIGGMLFDRGYSTIDALDASQKMLDIATERKIYRSIFLATIGTENIKELTEESYDVIVGGGLFSVGTVQYNSIPMLMNYLKKGGYIIFNVHEESMTENADLSAEAMKVLSSEWEQVNMCRLVAQRPSYHIYNEPSKIFVLQKM